MIKYSISNAGEPSIVHFIKIKLELNDNGSLIFDFCCSNKKLVPYKIEKKKIYRYVFNL